MRTKQLESIIEAILFTMGDSVEVSKIASAIEQDVPTTEKLIHNMMDKYQKEERGIRIIELDHAYQLCSKPEMYEYLIRIAKQPKKYVLTDVMLETLSIIAYRQPITKLEIEKIRGVKSDHAVNKLIEYNLVCELGRLDAPGRPLLFGTTEAEGCREETGSVFCRCRYCVWLYCICRMSYLKRVPCVRSGWFRIFSGDSKKSTIGSRKRILISSIESAMI